MKILLGRKLGGMLEQYIKQWFTTGTLKALFIKKWCSYIQWQHPALKYFRIYNLIPYDSVISLEILVGSVGGTTWL